MSTKIAWTNETWNPVTGCTPESPGCARCYAAANAKRFWGKRPFGDVRFHDDRLNLPNWREPRMVFVNSMSDLFHPQITDEQIDKVYAVIASRGAHHFQILTKRPERAVAYYQRLREKGPVHQNLYTSALIDYYSRHGVDLTRPWQVPSPPTPEVRFLYDSVTGVDPHSRLEDRPEGYCNQEYHWRPWPLDNLWLGVTTENQEWADKRIPILLQIPAAVKFLSLEPLLGPIDLKHINPGNGDIGDCLTGKIQRIWNDPPQTQNWGVVHQVIVGPETGPGRRPCELAWVKSIVDQCHAAGVPVFVKALPGSSRPIHDADAIAGVLHCKVEDIRQWPTARQK